MARSRILIVDDHEVVLLGLEDLVKDGNGLEVVAVATSEIEAVEKALEHKPDIVLMDFRLSEGSGIAACEQIVAQLPETKVIVITAYADEKLVFRAIRAGAAAFVLKQASNEEILKVIESTAEGNTMLDPPRVQEAVANLRRSIQERQTTAFKRLAPQEMRVLELIAQGKTNREIARTLNLSEATANNYTSSIISKLSISNRAEAAAYAIRYRLKDYL